MNIQVDIGTIDGGLFTPNFFQHAIGGNDLTVVADEQFQNHSFLHRELDAPQLSVQVQRRIQAVQRPDISVTGPIGALAEATGSMGLCAFARSTAADYHLAVRAFVGATGHFEDAASGAANATLAAWLAARDALPGDGGRYRISQGREVGHDAIIELQVDAAGDVWSGGRVQSVVHGTIDWR